MIYCTSWLFRSEIFCSSQAAANFGDQDISKCLNNLFLVIEQTDRILVNYNVAHVINRAGSESHSKGVTIRR